ncbi:MAG: hypothetical protein ABW167_05195 [Baekduia sp.]
MADHRRTDTFTFGHDEVSLLIAVLGGHAPSAIAAAGHSVEAFESLWEALTGAAYEPMRTDSPPRLPAVLDSGVRSDTEGDGHG